MYIDKQGQRQRYTEKEKASETVNGAGPNLNCKKEMYNALIISSTTSRYTWFEFNYRYVAILKLPFSALVLFYSPFPSP